MHPFIVRSVGQASKVVVRGNVKSSRQLIKDLVGLCNDELRSEKRSIAGCVHMQSQ